MKRSTLLVAAGIGGVVVLWWMGRRTRVDRRSSSLGARPEEDDEVDLSSRDSFPASDPPSWTRSIV